MGNYINLKKISVGKNAYEKAEGKSSGGRFFFCLVGFNRIEIFNKQQIQVACFYNCVLQKLAA
jgi:hypothetical protein